MLKMPKKSYKPFWVGKRGSRSSNQEERHYFGHDDRTGGSSSEAPKFGHTKPRVSFKKQNFKTDRIKNNLIKQQLDDDVLMSGSNNNRRQFVNRGRGKHFSRGRNSPLPNSNSRDGRSRLLPVSESNWYRIFIPHGQKYTKEFLLESLNRYTHPLVFNPIMYQVVGTDVQFYVEDHRTATKLAESDKKINLKDGFKLQVRVTPGYPPVEISDALKERLKLALEKRYLQETNALDLSKFYQDPHLASDFWCPLNMSNMMMVVLDIVHKHIPNLEALNLDSNKLYNIERLNVLAQKFEKLKILHIGDNKIKELSFLNSLKNLQLTELRLEGNPVCNKYTNRQEEYINEIRKIFPKVMKLDRLELPPPIVFDLEDQARKLPPTQQVYDQSNEEAKKVASAFLERYFMIFDSSDRQPLLDAYDENAYFSMTANIPQSSDKFSQYCGESRNLCRIMDSNRRRKLLKRGRLSVVSFISEMPHTEHNLNSFTMDICLVTKEMMMITVTGLFKELHRKNNKNIVRHFNRTFIIVPKGLGFCISNEQLHISYPTMNQEKQFANTAIAQPVPGPSAPAASVNNQTLSEEVKQQMTMTLSQQTNMNIEWSLKCLHEVDWNFDNACAAFREAFSLGKIPDSAFNK